LLFNNTVVLGVAFLAGFSVCCAQTKFEVVPSTIPGLEIVGPADTRFSSLVGRLVASDFAMAAIRPALPVFIVVGNSGAEPISFFALRFEIVTRTGAAKVFVLHPDMRDEVSSGARFLAGSYRIESLIMEVPVLATLKGTDGLYSMLCSSMEKSNQRIQGSYIRVSIDSALLASGQLVGPDISRNFQRLSAEEAARMDFVKQVRLMNNESALKTFLEATARAIIGHHSNAPDPKQAKGSRLRNRAWCLWIKDIAINPVDTSNTSPCA
jgi:hypothetical protein